MCDERGVIMGADDDAADTFRATVGVERIFCVGYINFMNRRRGDLCVPCSSTSCRCPGLVLSATVLLNIVMNSE